MLLLLLLLSVTAASIVPFDPGKLFLVDGINGNILYRGGSPLTPDLKHFDYEQILTYMESQAMGHYTPFPRGDFQLIDVSLLTPHNKDDHECILVERHFFDRTNASGFFVEYPIYGEQQAPNDITNATQRNQLAATFDKWSTDQLPMLVGMIHRQLLASTPTLPRIVMVHCMEGIDRTGEVIGAYRMLIQGWTLTRVLEGGFPKPKQPNLNALLWFEAWMNTKKRS